MPSRVVIIKTCDLCAAADKESDASATIMNPFSGGGNGLLVCGEHENQVEDMLLHLYSLFDKATEYQDPQEKGGKRSTACPLCEKTPASRPALSAHLKDMHETGIRALRAQGYDI